MDSQTLCYLLNLDPLLETHIHRFDLELVRIPPCLFRILIPTQTTPPRLEKVSTKVGELHRLYVKDFRH